MFPYARLSNDILITLPGSGDISTDIVVAFPGDTGRDNAWVTLELGEGRPSVSLNIVRTDEGVVLDLYPLDREEEQPVATTYAHDNEFK